MKSFGSFLALLAVLTCAVPACAAGPATPASAPSLAASRSAADVVKGFYARLIEVMKQGDRLGFAGRYKKLDAVVRQSFNLPLMTRFAVGLVWNSATPDEQTQLTSAFSTFSVATYANRFAHYDGEQFQVVGEKPATDGKIVETTLKPKDGDAVALNYLMKQDESGAWRIVDVFMNGTISELATRRAEFSSVIKRDGLGALVNALGEKSKPMGPG